MVMYEFNTALAILVRHQNHEMSNSHIIGVGNYNTILNMRQDLTAANATASERIWLANLVKRSEYIRQTLEQYKTEIRNLVTEYKEDEGADPNLDTSRADVFIRTLDKLLAQVRVLVAMGTQIMRQDKAAA